MMLDIASIFSDVKAVLLSIVSIFSIIAGYLQEILAELNNFTMIGLVHDYLGVIKYVVGENIYSKTILLLLITIFVSIVKAIINLVLKMKEVNPLKLF